ncbi:MULTISPECIES: DEAD/DEAH box helicase [Lysinibacillus]|uniref:DEAD/DEAH box helicase n=1 Tax=Lysinibacillus TaxID=400634 RepID=UPI0021A8A16B|nr:DEAD/DEAH box helicase [Lysinibacillus capsici]MCT1539311.1 DEAD/DEAH box helicase [Lysinibacillus capsici]MCT1570622.1 DEAD/DEAH box helicase [Lysinibacillus capsici]MCT1647470.1 DEAD/DEAH box helicase [Lysinibacillus capsici]MCT1726251.1 DEAD/DEAH box helicase [Lysinibacillus capsici]MCT1783356.1 DEAD/DEAH box helicase [Lysinibacillus capsici]
MMTINAPSPFSKTQQLRIEVAREGYFTLQGFTANGTTIDVDTLISSLFFTYEANVYGLLTNRADFTIEVSTAELLDIFSTSFQHPFINWSGANEESIEWLKKVYALQAYWQEPSLWSHAVIADDFSSLTFPIDHIDSALLETAVQQKLSQVGLILADLPKLLPFFLRGGWPLDQARQAGAVSVSLRLSEPEEDADVWLLETVLSTATTKNYWTPAIRKQSLPIEEALPTKWRMFATEIKQQQQQIVELLSTDTINSDIFIRVTLEDLEVRSFLREDLARLQALGFDVVLPAWLKDLKQSKIRVRVTTSNVSTRKVAGLDDILTFKWQFSMNGQTISAEQFKKLVDEKREFIRIGTEWFRVDANWMQEMRELMQQAEDESWTVRELLFRELPEDLSAPLEEEDADDALRDDPIFALEIQQSLKAYMEQLLEKKGLPAVSIPLSLQTELRPYQLEGFEWLVFMRQQGFGACLADDMGLGKTVQLITYLLHIYESSTYTKPSIIICPTSVLGNWQKELARFAPSLIVHTHYQANRAKDEEFKKLVTAERPHVILSTYGTVSQDTEFLQDIEWATVVLDEAQNIKNMQTLQSKAIRKLLGDHHIALTGTPVENRLSELWAIFDFIHKGYLGSFGRFNEEFILPIERDESESHKQKLRAKIQPFLLRRTKRDPHLQLNLPDKLESNEYCPLTTEQASLYEGYILETLDQLEQLTGFQKKGRVLKMLSKLKQLCNHPALYLKEPFEDAETMLARSTKLERIVQMAAEIVDNGEQCLIFTQYIGMGQLLQHCFSEIYNVDAPFLTGAMPKQQRDRLVEAFQAGDFPIFILSLKAGGTGLNLTAANHVLHADRWWNPAVENQATDRAYRIGQTQFVQVHKFVTIGTIEEKIDKMLVQKSALSEELIQSSQWLTELEDQELRDLITLDI